MKYLPLKHYTTSIPQKYMYLCELGLHCRCNINSNIQVKTVWTNISIIIIIINSILSNGKNKFWKEEDKKNSKNSHKWLHGKWLPKDLVALQ